MPSFPYLWDVAHEYQVHKHFRDILSDLLKDFSQVFIVINRVDIWYFTRTTKCAHTNTHKKSKYRKIGAFKGIDF